MTEDDKDEIIKCTVSCPVCGAEMVCTHEDQSTKGSTGVKKGRMDLKKAVQGGQAPYTMFEKKGR